MLLIFDWDGTLSDSTSRITAAMQLALQDAQMPLVEDAAVYNIIGLALPEAIATLLPEASVGSRQLVRDSYMDHFRRLDEQPSALFPGVEKALHQLRDAGHLLAVATSKGRLGLDRILAAKGMSSFFDATRCADETRSKPHPLMLQELLSHFSLAANEAVMVGDTEFDMAMACAIDMPRIGVSYGAHHPERLLGYKPAMLMDQFEEILPWVASVSKVT